MAIKPKKEMTDAQKAKLKKMLSQGGNLDKAAKERAAAKAKAKPSTSYSPKPMSAFAKEKAAMRGAETQAKTGKLSPAQKKMFKELPREGSRKPKAGSSTVSKVGKALAKTPAGKVVSRAKTVAREGRDVVTAAGTLAKTIKNVKPSQGGGTPTVKSQRAIGQAGSNLGKQIKEVGSAIISGKSGTTSAQSKVKREVIPGKKRK